MMKQDYSVILYINTETAYTIIYKIFNIRGFRCQLKHKFSSHGLLTTLNIFSIKYSLVFTFPYCCCPDYLLLVISVDTTKLISHGQAQGTYRLNIDITIQSGCSQFIISKHLATQNHHERVTTKCPVFLHMGNSSTKLYIITIVCS